MAICPSCGESNSDDNKFCVNCGCKLENMGKVCPNCGYGNAEGSKFCVNCGNNLEAAVKFCTNCGYQNEEGAKFCVGCGNRLEDGGEVSKKNDDPAFFAHVFMDESGEVRMEVLGDGKDETSGLSGLDVSSSKTHKDKSKSKQNLSQKDKNLITDISTNRLSDDELIDVLRGPYVGNVKSAASRKVTPAMIGKISKNDKSLVAILTYCDDIKVIQAAALKVSKKEYMEELVVNAKDSRIRETLVQNPNINDQNLLAEIYRNDSEYKVRCGAIRKINDEKILNEAILDQDAGFSIHHAIIDKITNQEVLEKVMKNEDSYNVRLNAVYNITDENLLFDVALNDESNSVRNCAVGEIEDKELLERISQESDDDNVRRIARDKLQKLEMTRNLNYADYDYARMFRQSVESSSTWPPENERAIEILKKWGEDFPNDGNYHLASVIIGVGNLFKGQSSLNKSLKQGRELDNNDGSQYDWLYNNAKDAIRSRFG